MNISVTTGFSAPVFDSQRAFRAIMDAMARPGSIQNIALNLMPPAGLPASAAASVLALCDFETALWVAPETPNAAEIEQYCVFQTGCTRARNPRDAAFAIVDLNTTQLQLGLFHQGAADYPDRSTTLIAFVPALTGGQTRLLSGPGIKSKTKLNISGLPQDFSSQWAKNKAGFPLGVDMIFCSGSHLLALPRSTKLEEH